MTYTDYLRLKLTAADEITMTFFEWRTLMNGIGADDADRSNMQIIDDAIRALNNGKADAISYNRTTGVLQLYSNGAAIPGSSAVIDLDDFYTKQEIDDKITKTAQDAEVHLDYDPVTNQIQLIDASGDPIDDPIQLPVGGGPASYTYTMTLTNAMESRSVTVSDGSDVVLQFQYSTDDGNGVDDGAGVGTLLVGKVRKATFSVNQGLNTVNIKDYVSAGSNEVRIKVEDSEGMSKSIPYTVDVVTLSVSTTLNPMDTYSGDVVLSYIPVGSGTKVAHYVMDGTQISTEEITLSGRSHSFVIPAQVHGGHIFELYLTTEVAGILVRSNTITLGMLWIDSDSTAPAIVSPFDRSEASEGEALSIPYMVYDPITETSTVTLSVLLDEETYSSQQIQVNRTGQLWAVSNYPAGDVVFRIACRNQYIDIPVTVSETSFDLQPVSDGLTLEFDADGRSNGESNPASWSYSDGTHTITASFSGFGWTGADGWLSDSNGASMLRFLPGDLMTIPFYPFENDIRSTGATFEIDLATRDVRDYESIVFSCMSGGRGLEIASQYADVKSEQSAVSIQFKEDSRIHITISIEQNNLNRFMYIYINGVMCGVAQYSTTDNFQQNPAVGLTIGANTCGIDLYRVRFYSKSLNRTEVLDNYICDLPTLSQRIASYRENDILNVGQEVDINKLPKTLPYIIVECPALPSYKGDKKTGVTMTYVDPSNPSNGWTANGVEMDVQGTSSQGYPVKNWKIKLKKGIVYTINGKEDSGCYIHEGSHIVKTLCMKADFASSENANNVVLAQYYNDICPYKTPPQQEDPTIRQGIEGTPCVMFWQNATTNTITFMGKYNRNVDKGDEAVFGFSSKYPLAESWEFKNNTSNRCLLLASDYTGDAWLNDFEARYPDGSTNYTRLKRVTDWVASTARLDTDSSETKATKLNKFRSEFDSYFIKDAMIFFYVFTEVFHLMDNRAKNMFLTTYDGEHWFTLPYDFDSALGINNEGKLELEYDIEDTDYLLDGKIYFTGQRSALWNNVRDAFGDDIKAMYTTLRNSGKFSYSTVEGLFRDYQSVWPEAIWNEDSYTKYLQPYLLRGEDYLEMLQGNKASQRDWWLFNAFKYRDSKYQTGDANSNYIAFRVYSEGDVTVTPYSHIWPRIKLGSYSATMRGKRNTAYTLHCDVDSVGDTETYLYSADRIASIGDISHLKVGTADFSAAVKLQSIILGSHAAGYENPNLTTLSVGNNELLTTVNIENCTSLAASVNLSGCSSIESVYAKGSSITAVQLPNGGHLKTLELPSTVSSLIIRNQKQFTTLDMELDEDNGYGSLTTLGIENTPNVDIESIVNKATSLDRVRLTDVEWNATSSTTLASTIERLIGCGGVDATYQTNLPNAVVTGRINVPSISGELLTTINTNFPGLVVVVNGVAQYLIQYKNLDNTVLYNFPVADGGNAIDPVSAGYIDAPTYESGDPTFQYIYDGWESIPTNVHASATVLVKYGYKWRVRYLNYDEVTVLYTTYVVNGRNATYGGPTPTKPGDAQYSYTHSGWNGNQTNVTEARDIIATYTSTVRTYEVKYYVGSSAVQSNTGLAYGASVPSYTGTAPTHPTAPTDYAFNGWRTNDGVVYTSGMTVTRDYYFYAQWLDVNSPMIKYLRGTLTEYESDTISSIRPGGFVSMTSLVSATMSATNIGEEAFNACANLEYIDLTSTSLTTINSNAFSGCAKLECLIIRSTSVATLANLSAFNNTKIRAGMGAVYVPSELLSGYKSATNWSAIASQIYPISAYPVTDFSTIADSLETIIANIANNDYSGYNVGDTKLLSSGADQVYMQLVAKDADDLADESGKAHTTWLCKWIYAGHKMNDTAVTTGGWADSGMRSWLRSDVLTSLPAAVQAAIKPVTKTYYDYGDSAVESISDTIWIPSSREVCFTGSSLKEDSGVQYSFVFTNSDSRVKYNSSGSASGWWTRSAYSGSGFVVVYGSGSNGSSGAGTSYGVVFGFCI